MQAVVIRAPSAAPTVPAVSSSQTLSAYTVDTFTPDVQKQVSVRATGHRQPQCQVQPDVGTAAAVLVWLEHFSIVAIAVHASTSTACVPVQFIATVVKNVEALSGSAVQVTIDSVTAGSVKVASTVVFLSGDSASASSYQAAITSGNATSVFGTSFGAVAVDQSSIKASTVSNPGKAPLPHSAG